VTDWGYEEVRSCADIPAGRLGVWRKFRHCDTSNDSCPFSNSGSNYNCYANDDDRRDNDYSTHHDDDRRDNDYSTHHDDDRRDNDYSTHYDRPTDNHRPARTYCHLHSQFGRDDSFMSGKRQAARGHFEVDFRRFFGLRKRESVGLRNRKVA
jgi:hypothetical protein